MKVLVVCNRYILSDYGGGQIYVKNLIDELTLQGFFPVIATPEGKTEPSEIYKGCKVVTFKNSIRIEGAREILLEINPDIVHAHGFKAIFAKACRQLNIACIVTAHHGGILCPAGSLLNHLDEICKVEPNHTDCLPCVLRNIRGGYYMWPFLRIIPLNFRLKLGRIFQKLPFILYISPVLKASLSIQKKEQEWKSILENSSLLIAPSSGIADSMIRNGANPAKIKIIPHGIPLPDNSLINKIKSDLNKKDDILKFFYLGRICHPKGIHILLAAFNSLKTESELHIIGGADNNEEERYMQRLKKRYKKDPRIIWDGKIDNNNVFQVILQYDVMVHPAICLEIFGLNVAEALSLGKPVIATRCGGPEMQIEHGVNGWLVDPNNILDLQGAMEDSCNRHFTNMQLKAEPLKVKSIESHVKELIGIYEEFTG
jgi:glycosyltransferase involved in cell wall biosynthesis